MENQIKKQEDFKFYYNQTKQLYKQIKEIYKNIENKKNMMDLYMLNVSSDAENVRLLSSVVSDNTKTVTDKTIDIIKKMADFEKKHNI